MYKWSMVFVLSIYIVSMQGSATCTCMSLALRIKATDFFRKSLCEHDQTGELQSLVTFVLIFTTLLW